MRTVFFAWSSLIVALLLIFLLPVGATAQFINSPMPFTIRIDTVSDATLGGYTSVDIIVEDAPLEIMNFDLLVGYDASHLSFQGASPGNLFSDCGWEYFTYRFSHQYESTVATGQVRIVGIAETNNGEIHPTCYNQSTPFVLASLEFMISNDYRLECQYVPIQFIWYDCADNTIYPINSSGWPDTLLISRRVVASGSSEDLQDYQHQTYPTRRGAGADCTGTDRMIYFRSLDFINGGIQIACIKDIDARGDINLNGIMNETADALVFANYFVEGISAFNIAIPSQIAATDVNHDGVPLSLEDLVYLTRCVIGDGVCDFPVDSSTLPATVLRPNTDSLWIMSRDGLGAVLITVEGEVAPQLIQPGLEIRSYFDGTETKILVFCLADATIGGIFLEGLNGNKIISVTAAGASSQSVLVNDKQANIPDGFSLSQNYPNPFNMETVIDLTLSRTGEVTFEIFNLLGEQVHRESMTLMHGYHQFGWDGRSHGQDVASGVYYYRLTTGEFSETKKMVLLK